MSYVSASGSQFDANRELMDSREEGSFSALWGATKAKIEALRAQVAAAEAKAAAEKAATGAVTAESEARVAAAKFKKAKAEKELIDLGPPPPGYQQEAGLFGLPPLTLVMLGVAGYFLFIKPRKRGGRR